MSYGLGQSINIALPQVTRTALQRYFNAPGLPTAPTTVAPRPPLGTGILVNIPKPTAIPVPIKPPVLVLPKPTSLPPSPVPSTLPPAPSVNVTATSGGSGGGGALVPSGGGTIVQESSTMSDGLSAIGFGKMPSAPVLIFLGLAALVAFTESGKKGRR